MFRWLIERPASFFGFLSGIFISVSTTALSTIAFAEKLPGNAIELAYSAVVSLVAATCWFGLGEYLASLRIRVGRNQEGIKGDREQAYAMALGIVADTEAAKSYVLLAVAIVCSFAWPVMGLI